MNGEVIEMGTQRERIGWRRDPRRRLACGTRRGISLIEVLVVIGLVAILMALLIPAVQMAREAARRIECANHVKQIGLAFHNHHEQWNFFPTAGDGWGSPPTYINGTPAIGDKQGAGWGFQILPYLEANEAWQGGSGTTDTERQRIAVGTPNSQFFCPSRRSPMTVTYSDFYISQGSNDPVTHALCDYASNNLDDGSGAIQCNAFGPPVRLGDIIDGASSTLLVGEKQMNLFFLGQTGRSDDNEGYSGGNDWDTMRNTGYPPAHDTNEETTERGFASFGSSHPQGFNLGLVDGSVRFVAFTVDPDVFSRLGTRAEGQPVSSGEF